MFPTNRNPALTFIETGDREIAAWEQSFKQLDDLACIPKRPDRRTVEHWVSDYTFLKSYLRFTALDPERDQVRLDGHTPSGVSRENIEKVLPVVAVVLSSLAGFAFVGGRSSSQGMSTEFKVAFIEFVDAIQINGWHQHQYG
ncbi:hypothetical protein [Pseudomonas abietaniphila]|nr:hypothetical protein [Pseudomonas abietaniphila]